MECLNRDVALSEIEVDVLGVGAAMVWVTTVALD
jgi:hypothetical protein